MGSLVVFDEQVEQLTDLLERMRRLFEALDVPYRLVGGLAVFLHARAAQPGAGRLTRDLDIAIDRAHLPRIREAAPRFGFAYRHAAGVDLLIDTENMDVRRGVHFLFVGEKVRPEYVEGVPGFSDPAVFEGALVAPVADLVRMKLTSYRLRDQVHIQDLDELGLITREIESGLSPFLRDRLARVRAAE
jgi:hypothetical protein